ncbi:hypothetical protein ACWDYJ_31655 [Streptomyces sp. NPDC003042]
MDNQARRSNNRAALEPASSTSRTEAGTVRACGSPANALAATASDHAQLPALAHLGVQWAQ